MSRLQSIMNRPWGDMLALLAGAIFPLGFAPLEWRPLSWLSLVLLFFFFENVSPRRAFLRGWLWGLGAFLVGISWVYNSMHKYGGAPVLAASLFTLVFSMYLALYPGLAGWVYRRFFVKLKNTIALAAIAGLIWMATEWLRAWVMTGFPWLLAGFAQMDTPFEGYLPFVGVIGVGGIVAASSAALVHSGLQKQWSGVAFTAVFLLLGIGLNQIDWQVEDAPALDVALVQGNIPQEYKMQTRYLPLSLNAYTELSEPHWDADLILWPETAMPTYRSVVEGFLQRTASRAKMESATVFTGIFFRAENGMDYYNAMMEVGGDWQVYKKHQLVPFGEYMPVRWLMRLFSAFVEIPQSDMTPAKLTSEPLQLAGVPVSASICYEMAYPDVLRAQLPAATLLVNTSNDAWFGDSFAPYQHLEMARARAREFARPVARSTNTGATGFVDSMGNASDTLPLFESGVLRQSVQTNTVVTPFTYIGQMALGLVALILVVASAVFLKRRSA